MVTFMLDLNRRVFEEALGLLPAGVKKVFLRSDTAGYQHAS